MKIIILNGIPGTGKSILAKEISQSFSNSFLVSIDAQRRFISDFSIKLEKRRELAFEISLAIIEKCFKEGLNIVLDKMMWKDDKIFKKLDRLIKKYKIKKYEFVLDAFEETAVRRIKKREGYKWKNESVTREKIKRFKRETSQFLEERSNIILVNTETKNIEDVLKEIRSYL